MQENDSFGEKNVPDHILALRKQWSVIPSTSLDNKQKKELKNVRVSSEIETNEETKKKKRRATRRCQHANILLRAEWIMNEYPTIDYLQFRQKLIDEFTTEQWNSNRVSLRVIHSRNEKSSSFYDKTSSFYDLYDESSFRDNISSGNEIDPARTGTIVFDMYIKKRKSLLSWRKTYVPQRFVVADGLLKCFDIKTLPDGTETIKESNIIVHLRHCKIEDVLETKRNKDERFYRFVICNAMAQGSEISHKSHSSTVTLKIGGPDRNKVHEFRRIISLASVTRALLSTHELTDFEEIGRGSTGTVFKAKYRGSVVAVKHLLSVDSDDNVDNLSTLLKELSILENARHVNVIALFGVCVEKSRYETSERIAQRGPLPRGVSLVIQLCAFPLNAFVQRKEFRSRWNVFVVEKILAEIAAGMAFLHGLNIVHADLKPQNVLLTNRLTVKLADFGLSEILHSRAARSSREIDSFGTPEYMSPELLNAFIEDHANMDHAKVDLFAADVFAFAIVAWETITGRAPYVDVAKSKFTVMRKVRHGFRLPLRSTDCPPSLRSMVTRCWATSANERPTFDSVLNLLDADSTRNEIAEWRGAWFDVERDEEREESSSKRENRETEEDEERGTTPSSRVIRFESHYSEDESNSDDDDVAFVTEDGELLVTDFGSIVESDDESATVLTKTAPPSMSSMPDFEPLRPVPQRGALHNEKTRQRRRRAKRRHRHAQLGRELLCRALTTL